MQSKIKKPNVLGTGTYGCVFYPSMNVCSGRIEDDIDSDHYITKIQKYSDVIKEEIDIGTRIQHLPLYDHYFAPVVKSCIIDKTNMDYNLVRTCTNLQNEFGEFESKPAYVSNKIRYVGSKSIFTYISGLSKNPKKQSRKLVNTHLHLLDALQILVIENIVHFDLKPPNIIFDDIQSIPIIIDFGLSRNMTPLLDRQFNPIVNEKLIRRTLITDAPYDYWCIDIYVLSNIGSNSLYLDSPVSETQIKILVRGFITPIFLAVLLPEEAIKYKKNITEYFMKYVRLNKTWGDVFLDLVKYYASWDNYSLAIGYSFICSKIKQTAQIDNADQEQIQQYLSLLKTIILAMPNERPSPHETQILIQSIFY
jgi:serine/threonine protein kinase